MGASISFLRNSMSRVPLDLDPASSIHTIYAYLTGLLLALVQLKYQALNTSPFNDHPAVMVLFLIAITLYSVALLVLRSNRQIHAMVIWVCHICGGLACELLLLLLVSPLWCIIINLFSLLLLLTFVFFQQSQNEEGQDATVANP